MKHVYLLQSLSHPHQHYIGITSRLKQRLQEHNQGHASHTSKFKPWELVAVISFKDDDRAAEFEQYLKTGSGQSFAERHFWRK